MTTGSDFVTVTTNDIENSCFKVQCNCAEWWQIYQQRAYVRLSNPSGKAPAPGSINTQYRLEDFYEHRAKRIAATYAQIYLEQEGGDPQKKGRFYWMGLGAFASKTVAGIFSNWGVIVGHNVPVSRFKSAHVLAKGNLWLFMDIAPWHWGYANDPNSFNKCKGERSSDKFTVPAVKKAMMALPWSAEALGPMGKLKLTKEVEDAFALVPKIETASRPKDKQDDQLKHLMSIAKQEQKNVLQEICWNDPVLREETATMRRLEEYDHSWINLIPDTKLVFHHGMDEDKIPQKLLDTHDLRRDEVVSYAQAGVLVENYDSRMEWIVEAARSYHKLMIKKLTYMEDELRVIAGWANSRGYGRVTSDSNDPK